MAGKKCPGCVRDTIVIISKREWCPVCGYHSKGFIFPVGMRKKCPNCGATGKWYGRCSGCGAFYE